MSTRMTAALAALILTTGVLAAPTVATADEAPPPAPLPTMSEYDPADYAAQAAELPADLVVALEGDVSLTPEEFLAQGEAAVEAVEVVDALEGAGVDVLGSRLEGTELVVNVPDAADAAVVESTGAIAEIGEPEQPWTAGELELEFATDIYGGQGYGYSNGSDPFQCSVGLTGFLVSTGAKQLASAGHCTDPMVGNAWILAQTIPGRGGPTGANIGAKVAGSPMWGSGFDVGRIAVGSGHVQKASVLTWGGGAAGPLSSSPIAVTGDAEPIVGATICKSGSRTGWTCGPIQVGGIDSEQTVNSSSGAKVVNSMVAKICVLPGDSGGPAIMGNKAVGITSWTANPSTCSVSNGPYGGFFQMISPGGHESVATAYPGTWEMAATVSAPVITSISGTALNSTAINGTVPNAGSGYSVDVFLDGSSTPFATATVSGGSWSVSLSSVPAGIHTYQAVARYGTWSKSGAATGTIKRGMTVDRLSGPDRYATSVAISQEFASADAVFIATGTNYPDALSAAPAAGAINAPLLLTQPTALPTVVRTELQRLNPSTVYIVGSEAAVSAGVANQIASALPGVTITRLAGPDRYATSRKITSDSFASSTIAYIATGNNFPDALSAAAAAGDRNAPVILVNGWASTIDTPTRTLLQNLGVTTVYIAGSNATVSDGIQAAIDALPGVSVVRFSGVDRFATSAAINVEAFGSATSAYLATGYGFPDALAGAALAASSSSPLMVSQPTCIPAATMAAFAEIGVTTITLLGSSATLSTDVAALKGC